MSGQHVSEQSAESQTDLDPDEKLPGDRPTTVGSAAGRGLGAGRSTTRK